MNGRICLFGEVLFDHFPDGKSVLGGAPFNVAWHLQAFGQSPYFISRVGDDPEGKAIREAMHDWGLDTGGLQTDQKYSTGRVDIRFEDGEPVYDIVEPCAYDLIEVAQGDSVKCRLLYHGSLALRDPVSSQSVESLHACGPETVFIDVNLRPPWWQPERVLDMVRQAHWIKLNINELDLLYPSREMIASRCSAFILEYGLQGIVLTKGSAGAEVFTAEGEHYQVQPETDIELVDTVGAGDAFASVMILGLKEGWPLEISLQRAQAFASLVVGQRGATVSDPGFYSRFVNDW